jgi:pimeloyl-ACP methyl ester carboxylesterase
VLSVKRYWDIEIKPQEYSYLDAAINQGYSILTYDRLGTGQSEVPDDAYDIVQIPTEVEILAGLTDLARKGKLLSASTIVASNCTANSFTAANPPSKIIHIGHSLGSYITSGLLARHGDLSDGSVMTGYYLNSHLGLVNVSFFDHGFAAGSNPTKFSHYPSGYLLSTRPENMQKTFLRAGAFAPKMLDYLDEVKQPEAVGTYASESVIFGPATEFKGPLQL